MKSIFEEYGGVIVVVIAIVALIAVVALLIGDGGAITDAFNNVIDAFDSQTVGTING